MSLTNAVSALLIFFVLFSASCAIDSVTIEEEQEEQEEEQTEEPISWDAAGLQGIEVFALEYSGDYMFAATADGLYKTRVEDPLEWQNLGLGSDTSNVTDVIAWNSQEIMAAVEYETIRPDDKVLFKSENGGTSWTGWAVELLNESDYQNVIAHLETVSENPDKFFAESYDYVIYSKDSGITWERIYLGGNIEFLYTSNEYPNQVWVGGWTTTLQPYLAHSADSGNTWENLSQKVRPTGGTLYDAIVSPANENVVLISSGMKSTDGGETWLSPPENFQHIAVFQVSESEELNVYASSISLNTLYISISNDFGDTWKIKKSEDGDLPDGMRIRDMALVNINGHDVLYIATNEGMISYTHEDSN